MGGGGGGETLTGCRTNRPAAPLNPLTPPASIIGHHFCAETPSGTRTAARQSVDVRHVSLTLDSRWSLQRNTPPPKSRAESYMVPLSDADLDRSGSADVAAPVRFRCVSPRNESEREEQRVLGPSPSMNTGQFL